MTTQPSLPEHIGPLRKLASHPVARNTFALYGVQFAGYVIPLVTLPYLSRVLQPGGFGLLVFAQSFALMVSVTIEYGFNLSASREVAQSRGNRNALVATASGVLGAKLILLSGFLIIGAVAGFTVANFRQHPIYLAWAIVQALALGLSPFWYFQGSERMVGAVLVELFARAAATASIFLFVRTPNDGWKALASLAIAGCVIVLIQSSWMYWEIGFKRLSWQNSTRALRLGWTMFILRGATYIYGTANIFILGLFVPSFQVGYFGGAEKIFKAIRGLSLPFGQAFYPHMSRLASSDTQKATRLARWTVPLSGIAGLSFALALALFARPVVSIVLGSDYMPSVRVLYVFVLIIPLDAVNNALIMHWMLPRGMERVVGRITMGAIVINVIAASMLAPQFAHFGMAWAIFVAETCQAIAFAAVLLRRDFKVKDIPPKVSSPVVESPSPGRRRGQFEKLTSVPAQKIAP